MFKVEIGKISDWQQNIISKKFVKFEKGRVGDKKTLAFTQENKNYF